MVVTPFDLPQSIPTPEAITPAQRNALRAMSLEKADIIHLNREVASKLTDEWLSGMTKTTATRAIRKLGQWLDAARAEMPRSR